MEIIFDYPVTPAIERVVADLIENGKETNGNISLEFIDAENAECYDDSEEFVDEYKDTHDLYMVNQCVCGSWEQPLTMIAVLED